LSDDEYAALSAASGRFRPVTGRAAVPRHRHPDRPGARSRSSLGLCRCLRPLRVDVSRICSAARRSAACWSGWLRLCAGVRAGR
jgi:hypothetical protein